MSNLKWRRLNLSRSDGHPPAGQMCLVRMRVMHGSKPMYVAGHFGVHPRDPKARKLWWFPGYGGSSNPANWERQYADVQWAAFNTPEGGELDE